MRSVEGLTPEAIAVSRVVKTYGRRRVLDEITFSVRRGSVVGMLGPNGSGKSTTVRILLGLAAADAGHALVDGVRYRDLPTPGRVVGVVGESSGLHPHHTARQHLRIVTAMHGVPSARADELLELTGLGAAADRRLKTYSLGMRQRLAVASALVPDPHVLVLDEPSNGLDPEGVIWLRGLLRRFAADGGSVLLASHVLSELEKVVDAAVVVHGGRIVAADEDFSPGADLERFYLDALRRDGAMSGTGPWSGEES